MTARSAKRTTKKSTPMRMRYFLLRETPATLLKALREVFPKSIMDITCNGCTIAIPARDYNEVSILKWVIREHGDDCPCVVGTYSHRPEPGVRHPRQRWAA